MIDWVVCPDQPDYEISRLGVIRRAIPARCVPAGKIINPRPGGTSPYLMVQLGPKGGRKSYLLHRLVARAFLGEPPTSKHHAAHNDGDIFNNSASNLRWATCKENHADKRKHGTHLLGENVGTAKLKDVEIGMIRSLYASGEAQKEIGRLFGVRQQTISRIVRFRSRISQIQ